MSSTNRGGVREEQDFYETQEKDAIDAIESLREFVPERPVIFEPMAGRGALVRLARKIWPGAIIIANEINLERAEHLHEAGASAVMIGDLFRPSLRRELDELVTAFAPSSGGVELTFTNPAFKFARQCIETCRALSPHVKVLQRTNFLHSKERLSFWQANKADLELLTERPHFAASLACIETPMCLIHRELHCTSKDCQAKDAISKRRGCGWGKVQYLDDPRPKTCPGAGQDPCGNDIRVSTSDSIEYAWFHFWDGATNTYRHIGSRQPQQLDLTK